MDEIERLIVSWGQERGILDNSSSFQQFSKLLEEVRELEAAISSGNVYEIMDAVGDISVVLIMIAALEKTTLMECLEVAYEEIRDRKGYMNEDGIFVKEE